MLVTGEGSFFYAQQPLFEFKQRPLESCHHRTAQGGFCVRSRMKARVLHTKIWDDNWFLGLSRASKILFLYLLTNQNIGLGDIYEMPDGKICYQSGLTNGELEACKKELNDKVSFYKGWVKIHNYDRYQNFKGPKNDKARENEFSQIPPQVQDTLSIPYRYPIDSTSNQYSVISNKYLVKKGGVGENKPTETNMQEIADKFKVPVSFVISKWEDLEDYCKANGKNYKDYTAALRNWVKRDAIKIRQEDHDKKTGKSKIAFIETNE